MRSGLGLLTMKVFQPLSFLSEMWALTNLPFTSLMLRCSGAIGHELAIRLEVVESPRHGFVGGKFTIGNSLVDAAMKSQNKRFVVRVEKDFVFEVSSEGIFTLSSINPVGYSRGIR